jgi:hypothetical protein
MTLPAACIEIEYVMNVSPATDGGVLSCWTAFSATSSAIYSRNFPRAPTPRKIRIASRNTCNLRVIELELTTKMAMSQQSENGATIPTRPDARFIPVAAVDSGRGGRKQEEAEPFDSTCVHHQVRRTGYPEIQTAPQSDGECDLGYSCTLGDDPTCPIDLEQMLQAVTARTENLELLIHVMRSATDEISN